MTSPDDASWILGGQILDDLPRARPNEPNAFVYIDAAGSMKIVLKDGLGTLEVSEDILDYLNGEN